MLNLVAVFPKSTAKSKMATEEDELAEESVHTKPIVYSPEVEHAISEVGGLC